MATRISQAAPLIFEAFDRLPSPVLRRTEIRRILESRRDKWRLAQSTNLTRFTHFLITSEHLRRVVLRFPQRHETLFVWGKVSPYVIATAAKPKAYLCHQTAMHLHGLSDEDSKTIYVNSEQRPLPPPNGPLRQDAIDRAFRARQRVTKNRAPMGKREVCMLNGKHTAQLGVVIVKDRDGRPLPVTGVERTLIDIAVRPGYAGGTTKVLDAYRRAKGKFSVKNLASTLRSLGYVYPYRQAIGFYLDRAGAYSAEELAPFRDPPFTHEFYLDYAMKAPQHSSDWRLHIPAEL